MSQNLPTNLGKYQVIREIARSNDIVYEGHDPVMNRRVALKELALAGSTTQQQREDRVKRFEREVKAAGSLQHPGIVTIFEFGEDQGRIFMAMEYLDGRTLRQEIEAKGFIPQERAIEIAMDVLDALQYAHENGVVHRDIKPENIQIMANGAVKLTDFGIARLTYEPNLTIDGQVFGTPSYMSPEQVQGKDIDARTDIWAVGAVLYESITGQKAFRGDSIVSISYAIMNTEPESSANMGFGVQQVLRQALERNLHLRYSASKEMKEGLMEALNGMKLGATGAFSPQVSASSGTVYGAIPPPIYGGAPPVQHAYAYTPAAQQPMLAPIPIIVPRRRIQLIKPTTARLFGRVFGIFLTVGLMIGLIAYGADSMLRAVEKVIRGGNVKVGSKIGTETPSTAATTAPMAPVNQSDTVPPAELKTVPDYSVAIQNGFALFEKIDPTDDELEVVKKCRAASDELLTALRSGMPDQEKPEVQRKTRAILMLYIDQFRVDEKNKQARELCYMAKEFMGEGSSNDDAKINQILEELGG